MNKLIHKGYFWEIFRQLKVAAIVSAGVLAISNLSYFLINFAIFSGVSTLSIPSAYSMASSPMYYTYIMGLVLTFIAYNWLNRRSYSDFYHALPISRTSMYFTTAAAILAWMAIAIAGTSAINALMYLVFGRPFNYLLYLCVVINILIAAVAVVGAVSLACAFSGTRFVNLVASVVILFMPRIMLTIFGALVSIYANSSVTGIEVGRICWLFDPSYNIAGTSLYMPFTSLYGAKISYTNVIAMLYNLAYAVLLLLAGWRVFMKRRSEDAGMPTTNKVFQTVIRCAVGMPLLLIVAFLFAVKAWTPTAIFLLVMFSFVFYCLYELISTKSMKKVVKAMPLYLICIAVCVIYILLPRAVAASQKNIKIDAGNIKGYYVETEQDDGLEEIAESLLGSVAGESFRELQYSKVMLTDERSKQIIADAFASKTDGSDYFGGYTARIRIDRVHGGDVVRTITFTEKQWKELVEIWSNTEERIQAMCSWPDGVNYCQVAGLSAGDAKKLAKQLKEEFEAMTPDERQKLYTRSVYPYYRDYYDDVYYYDESTETVIKPDIAEEERSTYAVLDIVGWRGVENYRESFDITDLTPKTADLYVKLLNDRNYEKGAAKLKELGDTALSNNGSTYFHIAVNNVGGMYSFDLTSYEWEQGNKELYRELLQILYRGTRAETADESVFISCNDASFVSSGGGAFAVKLTDEDTARAIEIIEKLYEDMYGDAIDKGEVSFDHYD